MKDRTADSPPGLEGLAARALFIVWGPESHGPRSKVFAAKLGIDVHFMFSTMRRGALVAPYKYPVQAVKTLRLLMSRRPRVVFVQSPPSFAVMLVALYCAITGAGYVVDAHSDAMQRSIWMRPRWLHRTLIRRARATIVTNEHFATTIGSLGGRALIIRDIPTTFPSGGTFNVADGFVVAVVNTFAADEPLPAILEAAAELPEATFYVTGRIEKAPAELTAAAPPNVQFTGFLDDSDYYDLLRGADAVMCLTTRDHTMQRGACEALSLARPIITSDWPLLRDYFRKGTVHVGDDAPSILGGVGRMMVEHPRFQEEIVEQQAAQRDEWAGAITILEQLLAGGPQ
jgi:glycosyltransferase involved in cell wall biosynthesis